MSPRALAALDDAGIRTLEEAAARDTDLLALKGFGTDTLAHVRAWARRQGGDSLRETALAILLQLVIARQKVDADMPEMAVSAARRLHELVTD